MIELNYCDRCGAARKVQVVFPNGQDLVFCGHHFRSYRDALDVAAAIVYDDETTMQDLQPA